MRYWQTTVFLFCLLACISARANESSNRFSSVEIQAPFDGYLAAKPMLMEYDGATVIKLDNGRSVVISVASTVVKDDSAKDRLRMQKVCRSKALANLAAEAKGVQVAYASKVEDRTQVTIEGGKESGKSIEEVLEVSKTAVDGIVSNLPVVGTWYSKDRTLFYMAIGMILDKKASESDKLR